jgi:tetratricopeptide (TPR) repeat protein
MLGQAKESLYKLTRYDDAIRALDKAIEINQQNANAWHYLACYYSLTNNKEQAIFNLKKAIEINSLYAEKARKNPEFKGLWNDEQFEQFTK